MIYPQATKYINAQLNPFAELFQRFRVRLADGKDHTLFICGYSFGDEHINTDIELAMSDPSSQLTLVAFAYEDIHGLPPVLRRWRDHAPWRDRVYVASPRGLYRGKNGPEFTLPGGERTWWTFAGVTSLLADGLPADVQALIQ